MDEKIAAAKVSMGQRWEKEFNKSLELDTWGQIEEAREAYEKQVPLHPPIPCVCIRCRSFDSYMWVVCMIRVELT
eukprot:2541971-Rhodomonas_salina.1